jgi:hypothetical protein
VFESEVDLELFSVLYSRVQFFELIFFMLQLQKELCHDDSYMLNKISLSSYVWTGLLLVKKPSVLCLMH